MSNESKTLFIPSYEKALMSREGFLQDPVRFRFMGRAGKKLYRIYGYTLESMRK